MDIEQEPQARPGVGWLRSRERERSHPHRSVISSGCQNPEQHPAAASLSECVRRKPWELSPRTGPGRRVHHPKVEVERITSEK